MAEKRPSIFIGSSKEGLPIAEAIQINLDYACDVVLWSQGVFGLGGGSLESLVEKANEFDFAILVLTPDDVIESRDAKTQSPRDNVLFELGLFIGSLGRDRTFIVYNRSAELKLPTDLAGVTPATYQPHSNDNLQAALGAASTLIRRTISERGSRKRATLDFDINQNTQFQIICDLLDDSAAQFIILMHEKDIALHRQSPYSPGLHYVYMKGNHSRGEGGFSVNSLCEKLPDAGLLQADLRNNVRLTERGHQFAEWLIERNQKASSFHTELGGWGDSSHYEQFMNRTRKRHPVTSINPPGK